MYKFTLGGPASPGNPSKTILTHTQVLVYTYTTVKFHLRNSINVRLTERSLYNRFCIERSPKWSVGVMFCEGLRYLVGTP